jgi:hypothetical protein
MRRKRTRNAILVLVVLGLAATLPGLDPAAAQAPSIRLEGVPPLLSLPLPKGANAILTAKIRGGPLRAVWLAVEGDDRARLMLTRVAEGEYQVNLADPAVAGMLTLSGKTGSFRVFAEPVKGKTVSSVAVRFGPGERGRQPAPPDPGPDRLDLPERTGSFTLVQRRTTDIPGGRGYYRFRIDDITQGQTLAELFAGKKTRIHSVSVREGDHLAFTVGKHTYHLRVLELINYLIGDDYGVFLVHDAALPEEEVKIEGLIALVRHARVDFLEDGAVLPRPDLARRMQARSRDWRPARRTLREFIEQVTAQDALGKVQVRRFGQNRSTFRSWLEAQAAVFDPALARREV